MSVHGISKENYEVCTSLATYIMPEMKCSTATLDTNCVCKQYLYRGYICALYCLCMTLFIWALKFCYAFYERGVVVYVKLMLPIMCDEHLHAYSFVELQLQGKGNLMAVEI